MILTFTHIEEINKEIDVEEAELLKRLEELRKQKEGLKEVIL